MTVDGVVPFPPEFAERYRRRGWWRDETLDHVFGGLFVLHHDRVALLAGEQSITYGELGRRSAALARFLHERGLRRLDRVVVHLPNSPEFLYLYFALQKLGVIPILALAPHRRLEIDHFVRLADAAAYFGTDPELAGEVKLANACLRATFMLDELIAVPGTISAPAVEIDPIDPIEPIDPIDPMDPCVLLLSGGTTGIPKLIPRTHNDYLYNSRAAAAVQDIATDSCQLCVLPLAHNMPLACPGVQGFLMAGARIAIGTSTKAPDVFELIQRHRVTHVAGVPALYIRWLADAASARHDLASVQLLQSGGQRLQPEVRRRLAEVFPNAFVQENFGMSEGTLFFVRRDDPEVVRLETVGSPVSPDDEVRLTDEEGRDVPDGEVGELTVRGPYTLRGYYRVPEYNARQFTPDGFYRSGDLMRRHPSGSYLVEGRIKDLVNRGGEKISAEEIENLILTHPSVRNVACVPVPDPVLGERMCACVIPQQGRTLSLEELTAFLLGLGMAKFKLPERLELMEDFPISTFGKVSKKALSERFS
jgi:2,3-dihydroxybenzoate-AMP ligase